MHAHKLNLMISSEQVRKRNCAIPLERQMSKDIGIPFFVKDQPTKKNNTMCIKIRNKTKFSHTNKFVIKISGP